MKFILCEKYLIYSTNYRFAVYRLFANIGFFKINHLDRTYAVRDTLEIRLPKCLPVQECSSLFLKEWSHVLVLLHDNFLPYSLSSGR
jgi:hypothetical protein